VLSDKPLHCQQSINPSIIWIILAISNNITPVDLTGLRTEGRKYCSFVIFEDRWSGRLSR